MRKTKAYYEKHPNNSYWRKKALAEWKRIVRQRANGTCEKCGEPGAHAHHLLTRGAYPNYASDLDNGIFLCPKCHVFHKGSAHGDPDGFRYWLETEEYDRFMWTLQARREDRHRTETWMEVFDRLKEEPCSG